MDLMGLYVDYRYYAKANLYLPPLSIRRKKLPKGYYGFAYSDNGKWVIEISNEFDEITQVESLQHELGHVLSRSLYHGPKWGIGFSVAYQCWLKFVKEREALVFPVKVEPSFFH